MFRTSHLLAAAVILSAVASAHAVPLAGTYDENTTQANTIEQSATFASSTGSATAANIVTAASFDPTVETQAGLGFGGVLTFDTPINTNDQVPSTGIASPINATFNGGAKSLDITYTLGTGVAIRQGNLTNRTPISANNGSTPGFAFTTVSEAPGTLTLGFGPVAGGLDNEQVTQAGFTFLSRTSRNYGVVSATATFSNGDAVTASFTNNVLSAGGQDTFFGFLAPDGSSISGISLSTTGGAGFSIDDVGLVTSNVPEPGSLGLLAAGGLLTLLRRR